MSLSLGGTEYIYTPDLAEVKVMSVEKREIPWIMDIKCSKLFKFEDLPIIYAFT